MFSKWIQTQGNFVINEIFLNFALFGSTNKALLNTLVYSKKSFKTALQLPLSLSKLLLCSSLGSKGLTGNANALPCYVVAPVLLLCVWTVWDQGRAKRPPTFIYVIVMFMFWVLFMYVFIDISSTAGSSLALSILLFPSIFPNFQGLPRPSQKFPKDLKHLYQISIQNRAFFV